MEQKQAKARKKQLCRNAMCVISMSLCLLLLAGCTIRDPDINNFDTDGFRANLKADVDSTIGMKAAYYGGRIYYLSVELGTQGIYSMNAEGNDSRLEIPVEDIRSINVRNDGIYYAGFTGMKKNDSGSFRQFHLLIRKNGEANVVDYLQEVGYRRSYQDFDDNVWDFYIADNGIVVICFVEINQQLQFQQRFTTSFQNGKAVPATDYKVVNQDFAVNYASFNQYKLEASHLGGLYFLYDSFSATEHDSGAMLNLCLSIGDLDSNNHVIKMMTGSYVGYNDDSGDYLRWFGRANSDGFLLSSVHGLEKYDVTSNTISSVVTFDPPENLFSQIDCGDRVLVLTQRLRKNKLLDYFMSDVMKFPLAFAESLYRVDPETGAKQLLLTLEYNNAFLYADAKTAVTGGGKTISIYDISGEKAVLLRTIEIEHNIVDYANKTDTAGGWLFLYRFNTQTQRDELIEKVYIG